MKFSRQVEFGALIYTWIGIIRMALTLVLSHPS